MKSALCPTHYRYVAHKVKSALCPNHYRYVAHKMKSALCPTPYRYVAHKVKEALIFEARAVQVHAAEVEVGQLLCDHITRDIHTPVFS